MASNNKKTSNLSEKDSAESVPWGIGASIWIGLAAFLLPQIIIGLVIAIWAEAQGVAIEDIFDDSDFFLNFAITLAIGVISSWIIFVYVRSKNGLKQLGLVRTKIDDMLLAFPAYAVYFVALFGIIALLSGYAPDVDLTQEQNVGFEGASGMNLVFAFLSLVVIAPFYEELLFRGFAFRGVAASTGFWPAAISTSALFGIAHGQINVAIDTFILGIAASWLVWHTKSLWPAILLHAIKNFIAFMVLFVFQI